MGHIYDILQALPRGILRALKILFLANWLRLSFVFMLFIGSFTISTSASFAQSCSLGDVQAFNTNLAAPGRNGEDVLLIDLSSLDTISCTITSGRANSAPDDSIEISHCSRTETENLCIVANTTGDTELSEVKLTGPGLAGTVTLGDNSAANLSAGTYNAEAKVDLVPVSFSFAVVDITDNTDQRLVEAAIPFTVMRPTVSIANTTNGTEPGINGVLTVTQTAPSATDTVISYSVAGTATAGTDYTALSGTVTILAGDTTAIIPVPVLDDGVVEGNETVIVTLTAVTSGSATLSATTSATNTIGDDDAATVSITNTTDGTEPGTNGVLTVTQTATSATDTVVSYSVAGTATAGSDYTALSGTVTILAGDTTAIIPVPVLDDGVVEGNETVIVTLTAVTSGSATLGATTSATNTIGDDDAATLSIANTTAGTEPGTNGVLTVTQTATSATDTVVSYSVAGTATAGTDYTALSGTVTVLAGDTTAIIPVPVLDDGDVEGNETVIVTLTAVTSGSATLGATTSATNTIGDDDAATVATVSIVKTADASESGEKGSFTISQSTTSATDTTIFYSVDNSVTAKAGSDYNLFSDGDIIPVSGSLIIPAGATSIIIAVVALSDVIVEGDEEVIINLLSVTGAATLSSIPEELTAMSMIIDDDAEINSQVSQTFQGQVHNYVSRRMKLQSRSSPSIHRNPNSGRPTNKNLNGNIDLNGDESGTSGSFSFTNSFDVTGVGCDNCKDPYFWAEAEFAYFRDKATTTQSSGNYYIGYVGLSLPIDERLTVGVMGQIDRFEDNLDNDLGQVSGTGWAIGPYFSAKVLDELSLDVRGLWGRSNNKAIQSVLGIEYFGSFDTERWIVEGILSGRHSIDEYSFVPSARIFYMNENWDDYTVSDGNRAVSVRGGSAEIGNLSAALEIVKTVKSAEYVVETFVTGEVYWDFQDPGIIDSTGTYIQNDDFSASISAGIGIDNENSSLRLEATYSGFGDDSLESLGASISLSHKF